MVRFCKNEVSLRKTLKRLFLEGRLAYALKHSTGWKVILLPTDTQIGQFVSINF